MGDRVRLGLMPPLTGLVALYGQEISRAGRIACDEVNERGGVLGRPLELVIEDDGSLPESAVPAARRLVDDHGCVALIGNLLSNSRISVATRVAEPRRIPYLNFSFYEGVEEIGQFDVLHGMGCNNAQGYLFARPVPENEMLNILVLHRNGYQLLVNVDSKTA